MYLYLHGFKRIYGYAIMRCPVIPKPLVVYKMVVYEKKSPPGQTITCGDYHKAFGKAVYCTIIISGMYATLLRKPSSTV